MTKHSFRTTSPVKETQNPLTKKELEPLNELLTKTVKKSTIEKIVEPETNLAKAFIEGLETNNYNVFGNLLLESKRKDEERLDIKRSDKELIAEFTSCLIAKDLNALADLLDDRGAFIVINKTFETVAVIKEQYINWLRFKLQTESVMQVDMETCTGCSFGKSVVIYNNGKFPWVVNSMENSTKGGLDFEIKNGKISGIRFCFKFQNTKNQFGFEKRYDIYKAYIDKGYSKADADRLSDEEWKR
jgi:hypothetical protein